MKQKNWFWIGTVLLTLMMFVFIQCVPEPLYAGITGSVCALAAAALFGYGLRVKEQERIAAEAKRAEETQKQLEAQRQTYTDDVKHIQTLFETLKAEIQSFRKTVENEGQAQRESVTALQDCLKERFDGQRQFNTAALEQIQTDMARGTEEIQALRKTVADESQAHSRIFAQFSKDMEERIESVRGQAEKSTALICNSILAQRIALLEPLENHAKESSSYYTFMIDSVSANVNDLSQTLQSITDQAGDILFAVESVQSGTEKNARKILDVLREDSGSVEEKLESVCKTLETQGQESINAMERMMQGYSDITAQDIEVLTALAKDIKK